MPDVTYFEHERLDVYKAALEFAIEMDAVAEGLPKGRAYLADQLHIVVLANRKATKRYRYTVVAVGKNGRHSKPAHRTAGPMR